MLYAVICADIGLPAVVATQVVQMKPWQRAWAARRLSNQFVSAIERASAPNRVPRGLVVDVETYNEAPLQVDFNATHF